MIKYTIKRLILAFFTTVIILSLTFILMKMLPFSKPIGDYNQCYAYYMKQVYQGYVQVFNYEQKGMGEYLWKYQPEGQKITYYFYQTPIFVQYFSWVRNIVTRWDWGTSTFIRINVKASVIIADLLPVSIRLNILSVIVSVPLGILLGIIAALNKNKWIVHFISTAVMIFISIPGFILITFSILIFAYRLHWLPSQWPNPTDPLNMKVLGYILPVFVLSFGSICGYCRYTRAELCEVMASEYLLLARTKGLTKRQAIIRHALRNAMVPIVPSILAEFIGILGGSMILENLYGIPGIGRLFVTALSAKDYNVLFVDMALFTTIGLIAGVFLDLSYGLIDPRIRMGARK